MCSHVLSNAHTQGFRTTFTGLNLRSTLGTDPERFCTVVTKKMNNTRNAVFKYLTLSPNLGARTRAQLPGNCPAGPDGLPGCPYNTQSGGKNLLDVITVAEDDEVVGTDKTYLIGGADENYADYVKFPNGTNDYDLSVKGRVSWANKRHPLSSSGPGRDRLECPRRAG